MLRSFQNFKISEWRVQNAAKRGGKASVIAIDAEGAELHLGDELAENITPELEFERSWARALLDKAKQELRELYDEAGKESEFKAFEEQLDIGKSDLSYREIAESLGVNEAAARFAGFKLRQRYRDLIEEAVAETVTCREEAQEEMQHIFAVFEAPTASGGS